MEAKGKELVCKIFEAENVRHIFGNPGSTEVPLLDHLCFYPEIKYVLALHESIAVSMADGYARASGVPGIANVHAAPGTAHSIGALYNAYVDNVPLILISGQQDSRLLLREPFLSAELTQMARPFTKWNWHVSRGEELPVALRRAFKVATSPPSGPVFLSISRNALDEVVDSEVVAPEKYRVAQRNRGDADEIRKAAEILMEAENPIIIAGLGVSTSGAVPDLVKLAEIIGARVYAEPCSFPTDHELYAGPVEIISAPELARSGDALMVVGAKMFAEFFYTTSPVIPTSTKAIHLDTNTWEIAKNCPLDAAIVADPRTGLKELVHMIQGSLDIRCLDTIEQRRANISASNRQRGESLRQALDERNDGGYIRVARLAQDLQDAVNEDAIIVDQGTRSSSYLKRYFQFRQPGAYFGERGGSLGWAIPAAMGVKLARPESQVVAFVGDGSMMYYPQALWTAATADIPIVVIALNNGGYMAVKNLLRGYNGEALKRRQYTGAEITGIDYVKMAESYGVAGIRVQEEDQLRPALAEALNAGRPFFVEVVLDPNDAGYGQPRIP